MSRFGKTRIGSGGASERPPFAWLVALLVMALVVAACGGDTTEVEATTATGATDAGATDTTATTAGGTETSDDDSESDELTEVVIAVVTDPAKLDAQDNAGTHETLVTYEMADRLLERRPDGSAAPMLATSVESNEDSTVWTIHLRDDVTFHNGDHMTARDVVWALDRAPTLETSNSRYFAGIAESVAIDDYTVEVRLEEPNAMLGWNMTRLAILPSEYFETVGREAFGRAPVASGPYKFVEWLTDERIVYEANDEYWRGRPDIDRVVFRILPEPSSQVAALLAGELDITMPISPDFANQIAGSGVADMRSTPALSRVHMKLDNQVPPLDIREVRLAMNLAIDVDLICNELLSGSCTPIPLGFVPFEAGYLDLDPYGYDPDRARELLAEAGFPDGIPEPINFSMDLKEVGAEDVATAIAGMLGEVGIPVTIELQSQADFQEGVTPPKTNGPIVFTSHFAGGLFHVNQQFESLWHCTNGNARHAGYYCNPEVDALADEATRIWASDNARAIELYHEAQQIMYDDVAAVWMYYVRETHGVSSDLNWEPSPTSNFDLWYASR